MDIIENRPILVISDLQIPYEHQNALAFCQYLSRHFGIPKENILNVGDETDSYWGSLHPKSPEAKLTVGGELKVCKDKIRQWGEAFPFMKIAISNHGIRWVKKAAMAEIPSQLLRAYRDIIGAPEGWQWRDAWVIPTKNPFMMIHGTEYSGQNATREMIKDKGMSVIHGHLHAHAQVVHVKHQRENGEFLHRWGCNTGCLIDETQFAFDYEKRNRFKPSIGCAVIYNDGSTPVWFPLNAYADKLPVIVTTDDLKSNSDQLDFFQ